MSLFHALFASFISESSLTFGPPSIVDIIAISGRFVMNQWFTNSSFLTLFTSLSYFHLDLHCDNPFMFFNASRFSSNTWYIGCKPQTFMIHEFIFSNHFYILKLFVLVLILVDTSNDLNVKCISSYIWYINQFYKGPKPYDETKKYCCIF